MVEKEIINLKKRKGKINPVMLATQSYQYELMFFKRWIDRWMDG